MGLSKRECRFLDGCIDEPKIPWVGDILITSTDNLKGFVEAIKSMYPETKTQICIVHQLRNSLKFVVWKDKKQVTISLQ